MFDFSTLRTYPHEPFETLQADDKCFRIRERKGKRRTFILTEQNGTFVLKYESKTDHMPLEFCVSKSLQKVLKAIGLSRTPPNSYLYSKWNDECACGECTSQDVVF